MHAKRVTSQNRPTDENVTSVRQSRHTIQRLTRLALLFALAMALSFLESLLPPPPVPAPGFKYGLSNIVIMYALLHMRAGDALILVLLKSLFALLYRGPLAAFIALCGGLLSFALTVLLLHHRQKKISYLMLSCISALAHNAGQFAAISLLYGLSLFALFPFLTLTAIGTGAVTAVLLQSAVRALPADLKNP